MIVDKDNSDSMSRWSTPATVFKAAALMLVTVITLSGLASRTGVGASRISEPVGSAAVDLRFEDADGGFIRVIAASRNIDPLLIPPGKDGFIRTALRGLVQERRSTGAGPETPFRLGRTDDKRLWLRDLSTERLLYLDAYGYQNAQRFARLFDHFIGSKE